MSDMEAGAVVVGIDGSESALRAGRWAAHEARSLQRPLRIVHATEVATVAAPGVEVHQKLITGDAGPVLVL